MNRKEAQVFANRWRLVKQMEEDELRSASLELMIQQTLSIWEIARTLGFQDAPEAPDLAWQNLQRKWMEVHD